MAKASVSRRQRRALKTIELLLIEAQLRAMGGELGFLSYLLAMALAEVDELKAGKAAGAGRRSQAGRCSG